MVNAEQEAKFYHTDNSINFIYKINSYKSMRENNAHCQQGQGSSQTCLRIRKEQAVRCWAPGAKQTVPGQSWS